MVPIVLAYILFRGTAYYSRCILTGTVFRLRACNNVGETVNFRCPKLSPVGAQLTPLSLATHCSCTDRKYTYRHIKTTARRNV